MNLNNLIISTLAPTDVPVAFRVYKGTLTTYITFFEVVDVPKRHADDELRNTQKTMQIDVWSKGSFISLAEQVKELMKDAGFLFSSGQDFYEDDTQYYHYALTYNYSVDVK